MGSGKNSVTKAIQSIRDMASEMSKYALDDSDFSFLVRNKKKKIYDLGPEFWESIREEISIMLVRNYNDIRIMNRPDYNNWKRKARDEGLSVSVYKDGGTAVVTFVRPGLRTGTLRNKIKDVVVKNRKINVTRVSSSNIVYEVDVSDLFKNYGKFFNDLVKERTGKDIFVLRPDQISDLIERILSELSSR